MTDPIEPRLSNARLARAVARMVVRLAKVQAGLAEGMWNPLFCSDDAKYEAESLIQDMRVMLDYLEKRINEDG